MIQFTDLIENINTKEIFYVTCAEPPIYNGIKLPANAESKSLAIPDGEYKLYTIASGEYTTKEEYQNRVDEILVIKNQ